ncbi:hypothetical protein ACFE04_001674 [Oxalis oulophora]
MMHEHLHNISELNELPDEVKNRLTEAGFGHFHSIKRISKQIPGLNTLLKHQYDVTDKCFKFEEYKFFYGLKDIHEYFGLSIDGRHVHCESLSNDEVQMFVREFLGGDTINFYRRLGVPITGLKIVSKDNAQTSDTRARAALLIIIGSFSLFLHFPWLKELFNAHKDVAMNFPLCVSWFKVLSLKASAPTILSRSSEHNYLGRIVESFENGIVVWDPTSNMKSPSKMNVYKWGRSLSR